ncbi:MAG: winged helix-turn-helix transcriptional regulator [Candidatus Hodarchaeales archaeon]
MTGDKQDRNFLWHCLNHNNYKKCSNECYLQNAFALFGKKHSLFIIRLLLINTKLRFNKIAENVKASPKTITDRLRELEKYGLVRREVFNEIPIRVEYSLTDSGKELESTFENMSNWVKTILKN